MAERTINPVKTAPAATHFIIRVASTVMQVMPWQVLAGLWVIWIAASISLGDIQHWHDSDTLLWSLISTDRLTLFYWGENRIGTLIPFAVALFRDPYVNLQLQTLLLTIGAISCPLLIGSLTADGQGEARRALMRTLFAFVILSCVYRRGAMAAQLLFLGHPDLFALFLGLLTIRAATGERRHILIVIALSFGTAWVNLGLGGFTLVAVVTYYLLQRRCFDLSCTIPLGIVVGLSLEVYLSHLFQGPNFMQIQPTSLILSTLVRLIKSNFVYVLHGDVLLASAAIAVAGFVFLRGKHPLRRWHMTLALLLAAIALGGAASLSTWPAMNGYHPRYLTASLAVFATLAALGVADVFLQVLRCHYWPPRLVRGANIVVAGALLIIVNIEFGVPSLNRGRAALEQSISGDRAALLKLRCTHLIGGYWTVWPRVFDYNAAFKDRHLWGVAARSESTRDLWDSWPQSARIYCGIISDPDIPSVAQWLGIQSLDVEDRSGAVYRYRVKELDHK